MPTYDYLCEKCELEFEREQRITDDPIKTCPQCKSRKVKRLLSAPGFILKGGGWYADGYGSSGAGGKKSSSSSDDTSSASTTASTTKESTSSTSTTSESSGGAKKASGKSSGSKSSTGSA